MPRCAWFGNHRHCTQYPFRPGWCLHGRISPLKMTKRILTTIQSWRRKKNMSTFRKRNRFCFSHSVCNYICTLPETNVAPENWLGVFFRCKKIVSGFRVFSQKNPAIWNKWQRKSPEVEDEFDNCYHLGSEKSLHISKIRKKMHTENVSINAARREKAANKIAPQFLM